MTLNLSNLKPAKGATKKRKDIGRGGKRGSYSGRGMKGQKARSGVSGLKALGFKQILQRTPKIRGFKSLKTKLAVVNIADLEKNFNDGDNVNAQKLARLGLIETVRNGVKVLGDGKLTKKLNIEAQAFSQGATKAIEAAGGQAIIRGTKAEKETK